MSNMGADNLGNNWGAFDPSRLPRAHQGDQVTLGRGFKLLSGVIGIGLVLMTGVLIGRFLLYVWIASSLDNVVRDGDLDKVDTMDEFETTSLIAYACLGVAIGVCWMIWQYRLAKASNPQDLRRGPGWHAWSWVIPIGNLWLPFQNVSDLWHGSARRPSGLILRWWWAAVIVGSILSRVGSTNTDDIHSVSSAQHAAATLAISQLIVVVASVLALRVVRTLTVAGLSRGETAAVPEAPQAPDAPLTPPGPPAVW